MITFYYDNKFFVYLLYAYYAIFNVQSVTEHLKKNNTNIFKRQVPVDFNTLINFKTLT